MKVRAHVYVNGIVQGVFFRSSTRYMAFNNNVTGWVKNRPDGKVEAVFEGERKNVEKLIDFCKKGPQQARVFNVEVSWQSYKGKFGNFQVL